MITKNEPIIRSYIESDLEQIAAIEKECFSQPWSTKALKEFTDSAFSKILVFEYNGKVAGYITYTHIFEEIQIANVAVSPQFRRKGVATSLIGKLIEDGAESNSEIITLEVRQSNFSAINLYSNNGFEKVGVRKNYYSYPTEDAILMNYTFQLRKE